MMSSENNICKIGVACTGCESCAAICPIAAIRMVADEEGFLRPEVNKDCIHCGKCVKQCPVLNSPDPFIREKEGYVAITKSAEIYRITASGGVFTTLAKTFLEQEPDGTVCGAAWYNGKVRHILVDTVSELPQLANSKYVQSHMGDIYAKIQKRLLEGRKVLFSGTPCQVAAVRNITGDHTGLITIDLICHGVPSPKFLDLAVKFNSGSAANVVFRWKNALLKKSAFFFVFKRGSMRHIISHAADPYFNLFMHNKSHRLSCYQCLFACQQRVGDITIGDCDSAKLYPEFHPKFSKNTVLINSDKGSTLWQEYSSLFDTTTLDIEQEAMVNRPLRNPEKCPEDRERIYRDAYTLSYAEMVVKHGRKDSVIKRFLFSILDLIPINFC